MANITLDLNQFKASGVYTVEFDQSERIILTTETVRLIVGFSKTGPFNAPVFLRDVKTARRIFGEIDRSLEKRGSFFHRSIETCLLTGPVFALNLLPLNNAPLSEGGDAAEYKSFSLNSDGDNGNISRDLLSSFYNKERFWFPDTENFQAIVNNNPLNNGKLFNLTNLSQRPMSFIVRKPDPVPIGYAITAREWYGAGNVPEFIREFDFIEDYFLEVIAIDGEWNDYETLSQDPIYSRFFDKRGLIIEKLNEFLALEETTTIARIVGAMIPDFVDGNGSNQYLETLVNNTTGVTGIFLQINQDALDDYKNSIHKVDLIGHELIDASSDNINFLSYNSPINKNLEYNELVEEHDNDADFSTMTTDYPTGTYDLAYVKSMPIGGNSGYFNNVLVIPKPAPSQTVFSRKKYQEILDTLSTDSLIGTNGTVYGQDFVKVDEVIDSGTEMRVILSNPEMANAGFYSDFEFDSVNLSNESIDVVDATGLQANDIIYIEIPELTWRNYFEIKNVSGNTLELELSDPTANDMNHSPATYVAGIDELTELSEVINNAVVDPSDVEIKGWEDISDNDDFVVSFETSTSSDGFEIVYEPAVVFEHENTGNEIDYIEAYPGAKLSKDIVANRIVDGDRIYSAANDWNYIDVDTQWGDAFNTTSNLKYGLIGTRFRQFENSDLTNLQTGADFVGFGQSWVPGDSLFGGYEDLLIVSQSIEDLRQQVDVIAGSINAAQTSFKISESDNNKIEVGYFIVNKDGDELVRVVSKSRSVNSATGDNEYIIETTSKIKVDNDEVTVFKPINDYVDRLQFTALSGFELNDFHLPKNQTQLEKIYGVIEDTNIGKTLASDDVITFRYVIDTFKFGIAPQMGPKAILSRLAKNRQKCMAILNAPSIKEFIDSTDPLFTDAPDPAAGNPRPVLNTEFIAKGGNLSLGPSFRFTLPDEENGSKFMGVFGPFLTYRENNKNIQVPPAADVSNNFIRKFLNGEPYSIVAGPRRGVLSNPKLVGLEHEFLLEDREFLEPFGYNPIVTVRNVGIMIFGNQSGFQRTVSAFNDLHVRDLLITLTAAIEDTLNQYLFEFNDGATRLEIESIVENFLEGVRNAGGIFDYDVIMDTVNNPDEVIDQRFGIIDVGIEPARGAQKFVNRITVLKTGAISSGGFTIA